MKLFRLAHRVQHKVSGMAFLAIWLKVITGRLVALRQPPVDNSAAFCFIVGCGNSGTTLLAAKLGNHPDIFLVARESHVFSPTVSSGCTRAVLEEWQHFAHYTRKSVVLEKTPKHVHAIGRIRHLLPDSKLLVIVRNPLDTCASLYKRFNDLDYAIERWLLDNQAALVAAAQDRALVVRYEDMTREPETVFAGVCEFLGLPWQSRILEVRSSVYANNPDMPANMIIRRDQVSEPVKDNNGKWKDVLDTQQGELVRLRTGNLARQLGYVFDSA